MEIIKFTDEYLKSYDINRSDWGEGEWNNEPDKANWKDESTGLDCMIVRNRSGNLCGYVGVPLSSKLADVDYNDVEVEIHGGLTYSSRCHEIICHVAPEEVYWFGFDCAHSGDYSPINFSYRRNYKSNLFMQHEYEIYRNFEYVKNEVTKLAIQIKQLL